MTFSDQASERDAQYFQEWSVLVLSARLLARELHAHLVFAA